MKNKLSFKNLFTRTRLRLDLIAAIFVFFILFAFSYVVYNLLTEDIIFQISPVFKYLEMQNNFNTQEFFADLQKQTLFLLIVSDLIIFIISMIFFDRMVKKMLKPIEYVSDLQRSFASNVSHELRNPLSVVNMRGEILMSKIEKEKSKDLPKEESKFVEETKEGISIILKEVSSLTNIIDDLLFEARVKYSDNRFENLNQDKIENIVNKALVNQLYLKAEGVKYAINFNVKNKDYFIKVNPMHLERVFNNLISNSFKFTTAGEVQILIDSVKSKKKNYLKIIVKDTGIGINQDDLKLVRERFYRGKNIRSEISGSGIGLAIVQDISNKYHWDFEIKSKEGDGTIITINKIQLY